MTLEAVQPGGGSLMVTLEAVQPGGGSLMVTLEAVQSGGSYQMEEAQVSWERAEFPVSGHIFTV